jgi:hypothetical protein
MQAYLQYSTPEASLHETMCHALAIRLFDRLQSADRASGKDFENVLRSSVKEFQRIIVKFCIFGFRSLFGIYRFGMTEL